jgi:hypothetical protein
MSDQGLSDAEIAGRMADAAKAAEQGRWREAANLYDRLGADIQAQHGQFDPRAFDAFEAMARVIAG